MSTQPMSDPFASIAKPLPPSQTGEDPFASIAKAAPAKTDPSQQGEFLENLLPRSIMHPILSAQEDQQQRQAHPVRSFLESYPPVAAAEGLYGGAKRSGGELLEAGKSLMHGNPAEAAVHGINAVPIAGPALVNAAEKPDVGGTGSYGGDVMSTLKSPSAMGTLTSAAAQIAPMAEGGLRATGGGPALDATANGIRAPFKAVRTAAIGDTDAAALRGLQVGPKSGAQLSTLRSVEKSRPYLAGASSQADMQARLKPAMSEVWNPYSQAVDAIGDRPVQGPDGMTTVRELEAERQRLSALNRGVKSGNPSDLHQAIQEGRTPAQLIAREEQVKGMLDPHLESTGIKPSELRDTYGALADVRSGVEGKTTLNEKPKPSGFGRLLNVDPLKPRTFLGEPAQGVRDIAAGRPWWSAKPTDLGIKEGFASGGPKPDLGQLRAPGLNAPRPLGLHAPPIELGRSQEPGGVPEGYRPPPFYHDTDAMRTGRLLHAPPIELGGNVEGPKGTPFRYDTTPMRQGKLLPPPLDDIPISYHSDIFPEQRPGSARIRPKVIEGKK